MLKKSIFILFMTVIFMLGLSITSMADSYFDTSEVDKGIITVSYSAQTKLKVMIQKGDGKYTYDLNNNGAKESFPLQMGNGTYKISLLQNTSGSSYKLIGTTSVDLSLKNPNQVFLSSIQNINWSDNKMSISKAVELTKNTTDLGQKAQILWDYMIKKNSYDYKKTANLPSSYLPIPDITLKEQTGICYDFSSLYAAMLRSQGTPAKLIKGYAPKNAQGYHAWNEVYDEAAGQWLVVDTTYDLQVYPKTKKAVMKKNAADYKIVYLY